MQQRVLCLVRVSVITSRFGSFFFTRKIDASFISFSGLRMMSLCFFQNVFSCVLLRVISVFGVKLENQAVNSFSLQSRRFCGLLTISVFFFSVRFRIQVAQINSVLNGGFLRIRIISRSVSGRFCLSTNENYFSQFCFTFSVRVWARVLLLIRYRSFIFIQ